MNDFTNLTDRYFAIWNEAAAARRRELIVQTWTEDATFVDPLSDLKGHDAINAMIQGIHDQVPGLKIHQIGASDSHHDRFRFSWELTQADGSPLAVGTDYATVSTDGRLQAVTGFFDAPIAGASS